MNGDKYHIDARRSSIYFFSVIFFVLFLIPLMLITPEFPYWEYTQYLYIVFLLPVVIVKVGFPNTRLAKWLAKSIIIYKFKYQK